MNILEVKCYPRLVHSGLSVSILILRSPFIDPLSFLPLIPVHLEPVSDSMRPNALCGQIWVGDWQNSAGNFFVLVS